MSGQEFTQVNNKSENGYGLNSRNFSIDSLLGNTKNSDELKYSDETINKQLILSNNLSNVKEETSDNPNVSKEFLTINDATKQIGDVRLELCSRNLWVEFNCVGNEMIVNKTGRRIFPPLKVKVSGLQPEKKYIIWVEIDAVSENRYRYQYPNCKWVKAGVGEPQDHQNRYIHPDSPSTGHYWMSQVISFDKLKLTNNKYTKLPNQVVVHSMHKYQPRIYILPVEAMVVNVEKHTNSSQALKFEFKETSFVTVTAYQNQNIVKLKIYHNPFAKGFREINRTRETNRSSFPISCHLQSTSLCNIKPISKVTPASPPQLLQRYFNQASIHKNLNFIPIALTNYQTLPVTQEVFYSYCPFYRKNYSYNPY